MSDQQAKYGAVPEEVSKTAQGNPGTYRPNNRPDNKNDPEAQRKRMGLENPPKGR